VSEAQVGSGSAEAARRRVGRVERATKESSVLVEIDLDGTGAVDVETGVGFYDHMLAQLGKHGLFDLTVKTTGDLHVDAHHTVEDTAIALGTAFREALGDKAGIRRFADCWVPLDEAAAHVVVDVPYGRNAHHIVEAQFKAVARALRDASAYDPRVVGVPSTKGVL
jgi:imidazoleglycerol-phosphate dehydratase